MREIDPFAYWQSHASAIDGFGGIERAPDPRYIFHTGYHEVAPGHARFLVTLKEARASCGELAVRVHAWKPVGDSQVSLVAGARLPLDDVAQSEFTLAVSFAPQKDVLYALYGYLSEDSDITARALQVAIDEPDASGEALPEPPRSVLALTPHATDVRPANALLHHGPIRAEFPVSQSCTIEQLADLGLRPHGFFGRERVEDDGAAIARWTEILCLNALRTYGLTDAGLEGLVVASTAADWTQDVARWAALTYMDVGPAPALSSAAFFDFLLMPAGPGEGIGAWAEPVGRWEAIAGWLARLKIGGFAMLGLRYSVASDMIGSSAGGDSRTLSRNEIGQWALRLIGEGYSVAPLAFSTVADLVVDQSGLAGFVFIVQRL